jgi:hypothetical protein
LNGSRENRVLLIEQVSSTVASRIVVELRYQNDMLFRTFEPHIAFYAEKNSNEKCVAGIQTANANELQNEPEVKIFNLNDIRDWRRTDRRFNPSPIFDRFDRRYSNGIISSAYTG